MCSLFFFQAEDGIRDLVRSRGLGDVYKRQIVFSAFCALLGYYTYRLCFSSSIIVLVGIAAQLQLLIENKPENISIYKRNLFVYLLVWCLIVFIF